MSRYNKTKKEIVSSILDDSPLEHYQVSCFDRYLITNGCLALLLKNPFEDIPVKDVTEFSEKTKSVLVDIYNSAFAYKGFDQTYGKLDFDKIKEYEKHNRFSDSKKLKATKSCWLRFDGKLYPIKQILDFLYIIKDATVASHGRPLCFWNGIDAGLMMPCIIKDAVVRFDIDGNHMPSNRYAADYTQFLRDDT